MDALAAPGPLNAACTAPVAFQAMGGIPHSRGALALAIVAHVIGALLFVQLLRTVRIPLQPPIVVELLQPEEQVKPKPPALRKEEPPPPPPPEIRKKEEPLPPPPPEPEIQPDVLPEPLPQVEMPLPPVVPPVRQVRPEPLPEPVRPRVAPTPVQQPEVRRPVEPVQAPPPPLQVAPRNPVRETPAPPVLTAKVPTPVPTIVEPPRLERPVIAAPEAPRVAPREPPRRAVPDAPMMEIAAAPLPEADDAEVHEPAPAPLPIGPVPQGNPEIGLDAQTLTALYLRNPKPGYPSASRRLGEQGTVTLRVFITVAGDAKEISLKSSSGYPRLDRAALDTVRTWKFVPAKRDDKPLDAWVLVPIKFSLNK